MNGTPFNLIKILKEKSYEFCSAYYYRFYYATKQQNMEGIMFYYVKSYLQCYLAGSHQEFFVLNPSNLLEHTHFVQSVFN